jgi:hypothetical protein
MTEYRIDINTGNMPRFDSHESILGRLGRLGELREVVSGRRYYLVSNAEMDQVCVELNAISWMNIAKLQGNLLR